MQKSIQLSGGTAQKPTPIGKPKSKLPNWLVEGVGVKDKVVVEEREGLKCTVTVFLSAARKESGKSNSLFPKENIQP